MFWIKCLIAALVAVGLFWILRGAVQDLRTTKIDWRKLNGMWLLAACLLYGLGTLPGGLYWHQVLIELGQQPKLDRSLRAFFYSQLGKYAPGKGMVIVMRTMSIAGPRVRIPEAVTSVFVETLTWMSVGAVIGAVLVVALHPQSLVLAGLAIAVAIASFLPISPPFLGFVLRRITQARGGPSAVGDVRSFRWRSLAQGWLLMSVGWMLVAASLWAVLKAFPGTHVAAQHFPLALECVTLAIVLGFVSMLPGGLGVRELVIVPLLQPEFGAAAALGCAILIRVIWLISESGIVGIIQLGDRIWGRSTPHSLREDSAEAHLDED